MIVLHLQCSQQLIVAESATVVFIFGFLSQYLLAGRKRLKKGLREFLSHTYYILSMDSHDYDGKGNRCILNRTSPPLPLHTSRNGKVNAAINKIIIISSSH